MTTTDRDKLRAAAEATVEVFGPSAWPDIASVALLALLDQIDQAEARIRAVRDVLDKAHDEFEQPNEDAIRRALDGDA